MATMEDSLTNLSIGEEGATLLLGVGGSGGRVSYKHFFVGTFLMFSVVNFPSMRATLANV